MRSETWKPIPSFPGYEASDHGRVRSFWAQGPNKGRRGGWHISDTPSRIMAPQYHRLGYPRVNLGKNGKPHKLEVSRLVLLAFIGPCPNGMEVCHNDGNPSNNRLDNLRYDTHSGNMIDAGRQFRMGKLTENDVLAIRQERANGASYHSIASKYGITRDPVSKTCQGIYYSHVGGPITDMHLRYKLSDDDIIEIRQLLATTSLTQTEIAEQYGVNKSTISNIYTGKRKPRGTAST